MQPMSIDLAVFVLKDGIICFPNAKVTIRYSMSASLNTQMLSGDPEQTPATTRRHSSMVLRHLLF